MDEVDYKKMIYDEKCDEKEGDRLLWGRKKLSNVE